MVSIGLDFYLDSEGSRVHMLVSNPNQPVPIRATDISINVHMLSFLLGKKLCYKNYTGKDFLQCVL